jgi:hypothetical protein
VIQPMKKEAHMIDVLGYILVIALIVILCMYDTMKLNASKMEDENCRPKDCPNEQTEADLEPFPLDE